MRTSTRRLWLSPSLLALLAFTPTLAAEPADAVASHPKPAAVTTDPAASDAPAPPESDTFVPRETISSDAAVSFPIDI